MTGVYLLALLTLALAYRSVAVNAVIAADIKERERERKEREERARILGEKRDAVRSAMASLGWVYAPHTNQFIRPDDGDVMDFDVAEAWVSVHPVANAA
jgi:hypothetical protein